MQDQLDIEFDGELIAKVAEAESLTNYSKLNIEYSVYKTRKGTYIGVQKYVSEIYPVKYIATKCKVELILFFGYKALAKKILELVGVKTSIHIA